MDNSLNDRNEFTWNGSKILFSRNNRISKIWIDSSKMENAEEQSPLLERKISTSTKIAYALGHIFNDLAAAMWFSYTLIYFQRVALLEPIVAGALLLLGKKEKKTERENQIFLKLRKSSDGRKKKNWKKIWKYLKRSFVL